MEFYNRLKQEKENLEKENEILKNLLKESFNFIDILEKKIKEQNNHIEYLNLLDDID